MDKNKEIIGSQKQVIGITGSHGHVGSYFYEKCLSLGYEVVRLKRDSKVPKKVTHVFDFAAYGNRYDQTDKKKIYKANYDRVVKLVNNCKGKYLFLTSTSSVLLPVQTDYSKSKAKMEEFVKKWVKETKEKIIVVRPSTITGVGEHKDRLIPRLIESCFTGKEMQFVKEPTHDFIDVEDYVNALLFLSKYVEMYKGHIFNISFGVSVPNEFIKDVVAQITDRKPNLKTVKSLRRYDTTKWIVPNSKIRSLGWYPKKDIFTTIKEMINYYLETHYVE